MILSLRYVEVILSDDIQPEICRRIVLSDDIQSQVFTGSSLWWYSASGIVHSDGIQPQVCTGSAFRWSSANIWEWNDTSELNWYIHRDANQMTPVTRPQLCTDSRCLILFGKHRIQLFSGLSSVSYFYPQKVHLPRCIFCFSVKFPPRVRYPNYGFMVRIPISVGRTLSYRLVQSGKNTVFSPCSLDWGISLHRLGFGSSFLFVGVGGGGPRFRLIHKRSRSV